MICLPFYKQILTLTFRDLQRIKIISFFISLNQSNLNQKLQPQPQVSSGPCISEQYLLAGTWPELLFTQKTFLVCMPTPQVASPFQLIVAFKAVIKMFSEQGLHDDVSQ